MTSRTRILPVFLPFAGCPHRCVYCDQRAVTGVNGGGESEVATLVARYLAAAGQGASPAEVAFYGGTFTALPRERQEACLGAVAPYLESGQVDAIRVSTRPDCVTAEGLSFLARRGVRCVELGTPSMDDEVLRLSGRGHTAADTATAARLVREAGLELGLQMMLGLPGDSPGTALATAFALAALRPSAMRLYPALVLEGTPLAEAWRAGAYRPWSLAKTLDCLAIIVPLLRSRGIRILRTGLHLDPAARTSNPVLAGPVHPALGAEAQSEIYRRRVRMLLRRDSRLAAVRVNTREYAACRGSAARHLETYRRVTPGFSVVGSPLIPRGWFVTHVG